MKLSDVDQLLCSRASQAKMYLQELLLSCNFCCCRGFIGNNFLLCFRFILVSLPSASLSADSSAGASVASSAAAGSVASAASSLFGSSAASSAGASSFDSAASSAGASSAAGASATSSAGVNN